MADSNSVIRVTMIGDASRLIAALDETTGRVAGIATKLGAAFVGLQIGGKLVDFAQTALSEFDRVEDATQRLEMQLGNVSRRLVEQADEYTRLGLSMGDVLELQAEFADTSTALGLDNQVITDAADDVVRIAGAFALLKEEDAATIVAQIGNALDGTQKAAEALGVTVDKNASSTTNLWSILSQLEEQLKDAGIATDGLEESQGELDAKLETMSAKIGAHLEGPLTGLVDWIIDMTDAIPGAIQGWQDLGAAIEQMVRDVAGPLARLVDLIGQVLGGLDQFPNGGGNMTNPNSPFSSESRSVQQQQDWINRNQGAR